MKRREFIGSTAVGLTALSVGRPLVSGVQPSQYRVAVIGRTGRGNYGHGLDIVWRDINRTKVVAVADGDAKARTAAAERNGSASQAPESASRSLSVIATIAWAIV